MELTFEEYDECFQKARANVDDFYLSKIEKHFVNTPKEKLTYFHYQKYCENEYNFVFDSYNFKSLGKFVGGKIDIYHDFVIVGFDSNNNVGRQNFTKLHEIYHYIGHYLKGIQAMSYNNIKKSKILSHSDTLIEQEADFGASLMQISDEGIAFCLLNNFSFSKICNDYSMSRAALYRRLLTYFVFEKRVNQAVALDAINKFRYGNNKNKILYI